MRSNQLSYPASCELISKKRAKVLLFFGLTKYFKRKMQFWCIFTGKISAGTIFWLGILAVNFGWLNVYAHVRVRAKTLFESQFQLHGMGMCFI